jgi:glycosyltransferase involved in cell wall biosynthesis
VIDVILPCLDEAAALPWVLSRLPAGYHAIVADNGSSDGSAAVARAHSAMVVNASPRGFGAAAHAGLAAATAEVVCFMDADGSLDPQDLPAVVQAVLDGRADLALGRRRPTVAGAWPVHARLGNAVLAWRLRQRVGVPLHDLGPMRAARRQDLLSLGVADRRFGYPLEMVVKAAQARWRITELDVGYAPRVAGGRSKVTGTIRGTVRAVSDMARFVR